MKNRIVVENNIVIDIIDEYNQSIEYIGYVFSNVSLKVGETLTLEKLNQLREAEREYERLNQNSRNGIYYF